MIVEDSYGTGTGTRVTNSVSLHRFNKDRVVRFVLLTLSENHSDRTQCTDRKFVSDTDPNCVP